MIRGNSSTSNERDDNTTAPTNTKNDAPGDHSAPHDQKVTHDPEQVPVDKPDDDSAIREEIPKVPLKSEAGGAIDETLMTATVSHDVVSRGSSFIDEKFDPLEYCRKTSNIEKMGLHRQWLYFFDSGGQIQFQKLLLAFMPCPSVLILVVNLSKKLSEPSNTEMELPNNEKVIVDINSLKIKDILSQMISAIASKTQQHKLAKSDFNYIKYPDEKLIVLTVGTHSDKLEGFIKEGKEGIEKIEAKQTELRKMLNSVSNSCTYDTDCPLYKIDGRKADDKPGESDDGVTSASIEKVSNHLKKQAHKIDVPLRWHYFGVILRKKANESNGLLSRSECEFYGKMLGMKVEEVHSALHFFHKLGMLFYYHESPTNDIVFVKLDCLIDIIRDLVITVSKSWDLSLEELHPVKKDLRVKGSLSVEILKSSDAFKVIAKQLFNDDYDICFKKLIALFQYLKIAAEEREEGQFVMPALLPLQDVNTIKLPFPQTKSSPLLFYFKNAVPMGFFCAIIVHLLSESNPWKIFSEEGSFSNFCTLQQKIKRGRFFKIALVEKLNCIEIYCDKGQYPLKAKNELDKAIDSVIKVLKLCGKPSPAFYCPCKKGGEHVATVDLKEWDNSSIDCTLYSSLELSDEKYNDYFSWFFTQEDYPNVPVVDETDGPDSMQCAKVDIVPSLVAVPPTKRVRAEEEKFKDEQAAKLIKKETQKVATFLDVLLDMKPQMGDLNRLFDSSAAHHYLTIGIALGVKVDDLPPNPQSTTSNLILVFQRWIDSDKEVTWRKVLQVCDDYPHKFGLVKAEVEKFLSSDRACKEYLK
ncbi:PREDICTED: uncharacterized protein LOC109582028 [Amphimedon queenslandica]|uniref:Death domain-containing protein n=1 Tax=Amphimedon queenslandica TaxID=400682 RepID=A0A1X7UW20_AMPQE|nr:PREDICTED: uncharacterized protein LOC109582028 [Amphimedon queenslandica]|eukprot:XP_019852134.1 PREDICTED: uncharacterized protein LOC109582028 [Amphimedon queenslandica]